ncbi:hypothetical protein ACR79T_09750 [Sphingobacterium spiritivorum]|uniref:hypothetical protein n=1 Tax=Sphingobacterium spiritivorum TaxID=258 RepID=UPI003DA44A02
MNDTLWSYKSGNIFKEVEMKVKPLNVKSYGNKLFIGCGPIIKIYRMAYYL